MRKKIKRESKERRREERQGRREREYRKKEKEKRSLLFLLQYIFLYTVLFYTLQEIALNRSSRHLSFMFEYLANKVLQLLSLKLLSLFSKITLKLLMATTFG